MKGTPAIYKGRIIDKKIFCAFVYSPDGRKKLVKSWDEFEACMQSGVWFASIKDAKEAIASIEPEESPEEEKPSTKAKPKPKPKPKPKAKPEPVQSDDSEDVLPDDGSVFEVTDENK